MCPLQLSPFGVGKICNVLYFPFFWQIIAMLLIWIAHIKPFDFFYILNIGEEFI
jgi:hypothetical protein